MNRLLCLVLALLLLCPCLSVAAEGTAPTVTLNVEGNTAPLPAGDPLPTPATVPVGKVFAGWAGTDIFLPAGAASPATACTLTALFVGMETAGELRSDDHPGITFKTRISKGDLDALAAHTAYTAGTFIVPEDYSKKTGGDITPGALTAKGCTQLIDIKAPALTADGDGYPVSATIVKVQEHNYYRGFVGAGYLSVTYTDGSTGYVCAPVSSPLKLYDLVSAVYNGDNGTNSTYFANVLSGVLRVNCGLGKNTPKLVAANGHHVLPYEVHWDENGNGEHPYIVLTVKEGSDFRFHTRHMPLLLDGELIRKGTANTYFVSVGDEGKTLNILYREYSGLV